LGAVAISDRAGTLCWGNAGSEGWSGSEARKVDDDFNLHGALWKHRWWIRGKEAGTAGRVNWSVECSAMGEANERRKRAKLRNICRAIAEPLLEHRTSLIFCLNLASNGLIGACEARLCRQTSSTGPALKRQRTSIRSTTLQKWALSQSNTPAHFDP
jgi:hypothetical protein